MRLDITAYAGLLVGGLGLAYWASLPVGESDPNKVSIFTVDPKAVLELTLTGGEAEVSATRKDGASKFWITYSKPAAAKPDGTPGDPAAAVNEKFLAGDKIKDILDSLNPLEAQRSLGKVDDKQAEEFGLKDAKEKFTVKSTSGASLTLTIGKQSYGSRNRFVRDEKDGRVLLINGDIVGDLSKANIRLFEPISSVSGERGPEALPILDIRMSSPPPLGLAMIMARLTRRSKTVDFTVEGAAT